MAGKPREDQSSVRRNFVAVRLTDDEVGAINDYRAKLGIEVSPAEIIRTALRVFLGQQFDPKTTGTAGVVRHYAPVGQLRGHVTHVGRAPSKNPKRYERSK